MRFEESWYLLNIVGFQKLRGNLTNSGDTRFLEPGNHQNVNARSRVNELFRDEIECIWQWEIRRRSRSASIKVPGDRICKRCGSANRKLEKEHIIPLYKGGKDESRNLQWLCSPCHKFKHAEIRLLERLEEILEKHGKESWLYPMYCYRLKVLRELNPPGSIMYQSYWGDLMAHYEFWYKAPPVQSKRKSDEREEYLQLERFLNV